MLTVTVLGPVTVRRDGQPLDVPAGKTLELLARLALDAGRPVRTDVLLDDLWAIPTGRNTLQSKVSQLRRALGDRDLLMASGEGYTLAIAADAVDATLAGRLATTASTAWRAGDSASALDPAREGLALFGGEVLADAGDWAIPHRTRLEDIRLALVETVMAARVDLGAGTEVVAELESLVAEHPLREGLWTSLVTALYRAGRQADALAAYGRVRRLLVEELGIEPSAPLRALEQQVLRQSAELEPPPRNLGTPGNVPPAGDALVGRATDLADVTDALGRHRLVTVTGPAGVGKTRLALDVARAATVPGGVWLVRLDAVDAGASLQQFVAETLHVPGDQALQERLAGSPTTLFLDNCEHVVDAAAAFVTTLLTTVPTLRILATSQMPLGVEGEHLHELEPLLHSDSVALFARRAGQLRRSFELDESTSAAVDNVCHALDGLPLAIELAAARIRSLSVHEIERRLDDRFALLQDPNSHRPERSRALAAAIGWSYDLLFPDDQLGLWALSCFSGSAPLAGLEHVLVALGLPADAVLDVVSRLVDRSLVQLESARDAGVRYRLLDSIRAYSAARLRESGNGDVAALAHARWYAERARWCDDHVRGLGQQDCLAVVLDERTNVDAALAWCAEHDRALGMQIAVGFGWSWVVLGDGTAGAERVRRARDPGADPSVQVCAGLLAGWLEASAGDVALAQTDLDGARLLASDIADDVLLADVDRHQAFVAIQQGRPDVVLASAARSVSVYRAGRLRWQLAGSLLLSAFGSIMVGDTAGATRDVTEAGDVLGDLGDTWGDTHAHAMLGAIAQAEHRFADAAVALERAADNSAAMGFAGQAALHRASLARVQQRLGDPHAAAFYEQAVEAAIAAGDARLAAGTRLNLARLLRAGGEHDRALALLEENERWYRSSGDGDFGLLSRCTLAAARDDRATVEAVLQDARATDNVGVLVFALDAVARLSALTGDHGLAVDSLAEADRLASQVAHLVDPADRLDADLARAALDR